MKRIVVIVTMFLGVAHAQGNDATDFCAQSAETRGWPKTANDWQACLRVYQQRADRTPAAKTQSSCSPPQSMMPMYCTIDAPIPGIWTMFCDFGVTQDAANRACTQACGRQAFMGPPYVEELDLEVAVNTDINLCADALGYPHQNDWRGEFTAYQDMLLCTAALVDTEISFCHPGALR